jgi:hypothetical protein
LLFNVLRPNILSNFFANSVSSKSSSSSLSVSPSSFPYNIDSRLSSNFT